MGYDYLISFVHIGCTSEDINNTSYACMIKHGLNDVWLKKAKEFTAVINKWAVEHKNDAMLAHTHGQPATPTTIGMNLKFMLIVLLQALKILKILKLKLNLMEQQVTIVLF